MNATTRKSDMPWARTVLVAAAAIATVSIGFSVSRQGERQAPAAPAAEQKQPDINDMISGLEARLKQEPGSEKGWRMLGWSYFQASRYTDAAGAYRKAAGISPGDAELWSALGESLVLAGNQTVSDEAWRLHRRIHAHVSSSRNPNWRRAIHELQSTIG
jgi:cytochrome c-type biogenesis protein CcmH